MKVTGLFLFLHPYSSACQGTAQAIFLFRFYPQVFATSTGGARSKADKPLV